MNEIKLTDEEVKELISLYIAQYEEYKKYGSVVEKVSPQFIIKLINQLQDKNEKVVQDYYSASQTCEEQKDIIAEQKAEIERLTEENGYLKQCADNFLADYQKAQKQVDELEQELEKAYEIERANIQAEIAEAGASCHWCKSVTVKNTAKEILDELLDIEVKDEDYKMFFLDVCEKLEKFANKYGVEVE